MKKKNSKLEEYYQRVWDRLQLEETAFKDIVGQEFEKARKEEWRKHGYHAASGKIAGYKADLVIRNSDNEIVAIEECKGHYVDKCFLSRFVSNAAQIINFCLENQNKIPEIFLCSATTYAKYEEYFEEYVSLFRSDIQKALREKVKYLSYCDHGRVSRKDYFKNENCCFDVSQKLLEKQSKAIAAV